MLGPGCAYQECPVKLSRSSESENWLIKVIFHFFLKMSALFLFGGPAAPPLALEPL